MGTPDTVFYDVMNQPTSYADGVNATRTTYAYDALYRLRVTDPKGQLIEKVERDALGRVVKLYDTYDTLSTYETFRYDSAGKLTSSTNRRGQRVDRTYDAAGAIASRSYGGSTVDTYSHSSTQSTASNSYSSVTTTITPITRLVTTTTSLGGETITLRHRAANTQAPSDTTIATYRSSTTVFHWINEYNATTGQREKAKVSGTPDATINYLGYTPDGNPVGINYGESGGIGGFSYLYTSRGRSGGWSNLTYQRDSLDRLRAWKEDVNKTVAYAYDALGRLIADSTATSAPFNNYSGTPDSAFGRIGRFSSPTVVQYSYDAAGNRTDNSGSYGAGNRITSFKGFTFTHDADGNITRKQSLTRDISFRWDELGRLRAIVNNNSNDSIEFAYDASDRMVMRKKSGTVDRYFLWNNDMLTTEFYGNMDVFGSNRYDGIDRPITWDEVGEIAYFDPWGVPAPGTDTTAAIKWKGLAHVSSSIVGGGGLYYMRARWYDPEIGRFLSEDPIGVKGGLNLYAFGGNDPVNKKDPNGSCGYVDSNGFPHNADMGTLGYRPSDGKNVYCTGNAFRDKWAELMSRFGVLPTMVIIGEAPDDVFSIGISASTVLGAGYVGGFGLYYSDGWLGLYGRGGIATGFSASLALEGGYSPNWIGGTSEAICGSLIVSYCASNSGRSGGIGFRDVGLAAGAHAEISSTYTQPLVQIIGYNPFLNFANEFRLFNNCRNFGICR